MKKLNQQLYDQLNGSILYLLKYVRKHNIIFPNRERLLNLMDNIRFITNEIKEYHKSIIYQKAEVATQNQHPF